MTGAPRQIGMMTVARMERHSNAVIAATYYLRLISVMYFEQSTTVSEPSNQNAAWVAGCLCAVATLVLFVAPQWLWNAAALALN